MWLFGKFSIGVAAEHPLQHRPPPLPHVPFSYTLPDRPEKAAVPLPFCLLQLFSRSAVRCSRFSGSLSPSMPSHTSDHCHETGRPYLSVCLLSSQLFLRVPRVPLCSLPAVSLLPLGLLPASCLRFIGCPILSRKRPACRPRLTNCSKVV